MINFRFHIASLIAVFLALALGVRHGLDGHRPGDRRRAARPDRQGREATPTTQRAENGGCKSQNDQLNHYAEQSAPWAVEGQLTDQPVAIVAERGVDEDTVKAQAALLRQAGAVVPGILWLEDAVEPRR